MLPLKIKLLVSNEAHGCTLVEHDEWEYRILRNVRVPEPLSMREVLGGRYCRSIGLNLSKVGEAQGPIHSCETGSCGSFFGLTERRINKVVTASRR